MRITNGMMINNTLSHINQNKLNVDKYNTQEATGKKIQRPSDDPVIAVRALRFRSQLAEMAQYLEKNIPDADAWLKLTEEILDGVSGTLSDMTKYINQGSNDTNFLDDREAIVKTLKGFRDTVFHDANQDYGGRRIFSGYKTDTDMTFFSTDKTVKYKIEENFTFSDFDTISKVFDGVDLKKPIAEIDAKDMPTDKTDIHRIRLAYDKLTPKTAAENTAGAAEAPVVTIDGAAATVKVISPDPNGNYVDETGTQVNPYKPGDNEIYFLADSGEMIFGVTQYQNMRNAEISVEYYKTGFEKGDLRPEHYFDCTRYEADGTTIDVEFESHQQDINYTINFNQRLKVNSEGRDLFSHDVLRDLDEVINAVQDLDLINDKITQIEKMQADPAYKNQEKELASMLKAAQKEYDLQQDIVQKRFEKSITLYTEHQRNVDAEIADIGSRDSRCQLNKARLTEQKTTLDELKSSNEDTNLPETIINLSAASMVYDASLSAASKVITKSLLDYL